jgi:hypothetical protein
LGLTKAHVRHLEGKLIALALDAKRAKVVNVTAPDFDRLPEADLAEMEELLGHIQLLLGTLGVDAFQAVPARDDSTNESSTVHGVHLQMQGKGHCAECTFLDGGFTVLKGSVARLDETPSLSDAVRSLRAALQSNGVLVPEEDGLRFTQDYGFESASGAAGVVSGSPVNGKIAWQLDDGRTFKEWEQDTIDASQ